MIIHEPVADPVALLREALAQLRTDPGPLLEPSWTVLATANTEGHPSARVVLVREVDPQGWCYFYTNYNSRKAQELASQPRAALCFFWDHLGQQIRIEGQVELTTRAQSEAYFAQRPRANQMGAWASQQSTPLAHREQLETAVTAVEARFAEQNVPCPPHWGGYRLLAQQIEFWQGHMHRLHDRIRYTRDESGWKHCLLWP